jgi:hypothetical protein
MNEDGFWQLIQDVHDRWPADMQAKSSAIFNALGRLPKQDAIDFARLFDRMMHRAFTWPLWGAAFVIGGGCSDDAFLDFRSSLISRGKAAFEKALADPDSLADDEPDEMSWFFEGYQYSVLDGAQQAAGGELPERVQHPDMPSGKPWDEDTVIGLYPKLAAKLGLSG